MSKNIPIVLILVGIFFLLIIIITGIYYFRPNLIKSWFNNGPQQAENSGQDTQHPETAPQPEWTVYTNEEIGFSIEYPSNLQINEMAISQISFVDYDQQESGQFRNLSVTITFGSLEDNNLQPLVEDQRANQSVESTRSGELIQTNIANKDGYTFTYTDTQEFEYIYLPWDDNNYLRIIVMDSNGTVEDRQMIDKMLASLKEV